MASPRPETADPWEEPEETILWQPEISDDELEEVDLDDNPRESAASPPRMLAFDNESLISTPKRKPPDRTVKAPTSSGSVSPIDLKTALEMEGPYVKNTYRHEFADEREEDGGEAVGSSHPSSSAQVVPLVTDVENVEVFSTPKSKPFSPMKRSKFKGETLTPQKAIEFMIRERQDMDSEYASLRKQNQELKSELENRYLAFKEREQQITPSPSRVVVERTVRNREEEERWRQETERVRRENEMLRTQLKDNEDKLRQHYENLLRKVSSEAESLKNTSRESSPEEMRPESSQRLSRGGRAKEGRDFDSTRRRGRDSYEEMSSSVSPVVQQSAKVQLHTEISTRRAQQGTNDTLIPVRRFMWLGANLWKVPYSGGGYPERRMVKLRRETKPGPSARQIRIVNDDGSFDPNFDPNKRQLFIAFPLTLMWYASGKSGDEANLRELVLNRDAHIIPGNSSLHSQS